MKDEKDQIATRRKQVVGNKLTISQMTTIATGTVEEAVEALREAEEAYTLMAGGRIWTVAHTLNEDVGCTTCQAMDGRIATHCPGHYQTAVVDKRIFEEKIDFVCGQWIAGDAHLTRELLLTEHRMTQHENEDRDHEEGKP